MRRPPASIGLAGLDRAVHVQQPGGLERVRHDLHPVALLPDVVLGHVVGVVVGQQQQPHVEPVPVGGLEQRLGRAARVDHHAGAALLVAHEVGVREPVRLHGALDDHRWRRSLVSARVDQLRREFPVFERKAYLNAGTNGPVPARAAEAARAAIERQASEGRSGKALIEGLIEQLGAAAHARGRTARLRRDRGGAHGLHHRRRERRARRARPARRATRS